MNWFLHVVTKNYVNFNGRAGLSEYWFFVLFHIIFIVVASVIDAVLGLGVLSLLYSLAVLLPSLGVTIRRLHDTDRTAWWVLISLIPIIGTIWLIILMIQKGTEGENQYGKPGPTAPTAAAV
ncbi:DUF805 domain-containing protein [uncultured Rhodospira sp.]|uniref:DUF805 domain-containing protein n=1 Tax=uncultured Rhodospira sp. TaxID=1936189 RepID=UPI002637755A|nr:DUF805 domain-containing protein [uncultured Rhodospira sp.]